MNSYLKNGFYLGLGAAMAGKEKVEKILDEMVVNGEISAPQAKQMFNEFMEKGKLKDEEWQMRSKAKMKDKFESLGFVTKEEYIALAKRVEMLEQQLGNRQMQPPEEPKPPFSEA